MGSSSNISGSPSPAAGVLDAGDDVRDLLEVPPAAVDAAAFGRSIVRQRASGSTLNDQQIGYEF